jgi:hypothetical protein
MGAPNMTEGIGAAGRETAGIAMDIIGPLTDAELESTTLPSLRLLAGFVGPPAKRFNAGTRKTANAAVAVFLKVNFIIASRIARRESLISSPVKRTQIEFLERRIAEDILRRCLTKRLMVRL